MNVETSDWRLMGLEQRKRKGGDLRANGNGEKPWICTIGIGLMSEIGDMNCLSSCLCLYDVCFW